MENELLLEYLKERIEKIDEKVDRLLEFKWQIIGGSVVLSVICGILTQLFFKA